MKEILIKKLLDKFYEYAETIEDVTLKNVNEVILTTQDKWGKATLIIKYEEMEKDGKISKN